MKRTLLCGWLAVAAASLSAADPDLQAEVKAAAAALADQNSYSWLATVDTANNSQFRGTGPSEGRTEKDGFTHITMSFGDNDNEAVLKGTNVVIKMPNTGWQTVDESSRSDGNGGFSPRGFLIRTLQNYKLPAAQAADLAEEAKDLKRDTNGISGQLTEEEAAALLRRRGRNGDGASVGNAKGSVTFWIADGKLAKYQFRVQGTVSFNGNDRDVDRTTTVEIRDVNTTKVRVPDEAKKKLM